MAFCNNCGTEIPNGASFCPACGTVSEDCEKPKKTYYFMQESRPVSEVTRARESCIMGMGIAAGALAWLPGACVVAFILGAVTRKAYMKIYRSGTPVGGKLKTGGIFAKIGVVGGVVSTLFWLCYYLMFRY